MADAYWKYGDGKQQTLPLASPAAKRPRSDYEFSSSQGSDIPAYFPGEDDRCGVRVVRDTEDINASYDRYLRSSQMAENGRSVSSGISGHHHIDEPRGAGIGVSDLVMASKGQSGGRHEIPLPRDASSTLFVESLPLNCTRREVSHIFRPFVGYKDVRLITKDSRQRPGGDPLILCFVDFESPAHAATAMDALQGYKFDETDRDSPNLRLQFARYPGARSGSSRRGKR